ncbi:MAG: Tex-like N-terminal domain-containing protein, partial [Novipirellula sp. JB048]
MTVDLKAIARRGRCEESSLRIALPLLEQGYSPPFLARYRRDELNDLDEASLWALADALQAEQQLAARRAELLESWRATPIADPALGRAIEKASSKRMLERLARRIKLESNEAADSATRLSVRVLNPQKGDGDDLHAIAESMEGIDDANEASAKLEKSLAGRLAGDPRMINAAVQWLGKHAKIHVIDIHDPHSSADHAEPKAERDRKPGSSSSRTLDPKTATSASDDRSAAPLSTVPAAKETEGKETEGKETEAKETAAKAAAAEPAETPVPTSAVTAEAAATDTTPAPTEANTAEANTAEANTAEDQSPEPTTAEAPAAAQPTATQPTAAPQGSDEGDAANAESSEPESSEPASSPAATATDAAPPVSTDTSSEAAATAPPADPTATPDSTPPPASGEQPAADSAAVDLASEIGFAPDTSVKAKAEKKPEPVPAKKPKKVSPRQRRRRWLMSVLKPLQGKRIPASKLSSFQTVMLARALRSQVANCSFEYDANRLVAELQSTAERINPRLADMLRSILIENEAEIRGAAEAAWWDELKERASTRLLGIAADHLRKQVNRSGVEAKVIMSIDAVGPRTAATAIVSNDGRLLHCEDLPCQLSAAMRSQAVLRMGELIHAHQVDLIVVSNGPARRGCLVAVSELVKQSPENSIRWTLADRSGADTYAGSQVADQEMRTTPRRFRSAAWIAFSILQPAGAIAKIDPLKLRLGSFQRELPDPALMEVLDDVMVSGALRGGVDVNSAPTSWLCRLPGITPEVADAIDAARRTALFQSRTQLEELEQWGDVASTRQALPFLRVFGSEEVLDGTLIHPEDYPLAKKLASTLEIELPPATPPGYEPPNFEETPESSTPESSAPTNSAPESSPPNDPGDADQAGETEEKPFGLTADAEAPQPAPETQDGEAQGGESQGAEAEGAAETPEQASPEPAAEAGSETAAS